MAKLRLYLLSLAFPAVLAPAVIPTTACSSATPAHRPRDKDGSAGSGGTGVGTGGGGGVGATGMGGGIDTGGGAGGASGDPDNPVSCGEAAQRRTYVGCEFWPTVTFNPVYAVFDFTVVVANAAPVAAQVTVDGAGSTPQTITVQPGELSKIYLPWVNPLKGGEFDNCTLGGRPTTSVRANKGAYHLTSTVPITAWQFNPLEYKAGAGGPPGKNWTCPYPPALCNGDGVQCLSVSNDAALLIPTSAMTGNYRLFGKSGAKTGNSTPDKDPDSPGAYAITATEDGTTVTVRLSASGAVEAGPDVPGIPAGGQAMLNMNRGDVVQLLGTRAVSWGEPNSDLSGSLVLANKPIQVIASVPITNIPTPEMANNGFADHLEEIVLPAEVIGDQYVVAPPTTAQGNTVGHYVRFYGNFDNTTLSYPAGATPAGAPTALAAGQVVEIGPVKEAFEVKGSLAFAVSSVMMGGQVQDPPNGTRGDPALSIMVAVKQYRKTYTFLAPNDYLVNYADIVAPSAAVLSLDGAALSATPTPVGSSGWVVYRQQLAQTGTGSHVLQSDMGVGLQVMGAGHATSYYYPGGLNLEKITMPPE